jgi:hypothetical protein
MNRLFKECTSSFTAAGLQRTFEHELGHLLGLLDYANSCDTTGNSAVMQANFNCGATPSTTVSINDYLPVNNTVYGGKTTKTCGF